MSLLLLLLSLLLYYYVYVYYYITIHRGDKVSRPTCMSTHTYPHKPLMKIKVTICNHQADSPFHVWPDVFSNNLQV